MQMFIIYKKKNLFVSTKNYINVVRNYYIKSVNAKKK